MKMDDNCIVVSIVEPKIEELKQYLGKYYKYADTVENLVKNHYNDNYDEFMAFLMGFDGELNIYAGPRNLVKLHIFFLKQIFKNKTKAQVVDLSKMITNNIISITRGGYLDFYYQTPGEMAAWAKISNVYVNQDMNAFYYSLPMTAAANNRTFFEQNCSIEFQLARYLKDPVWANKHVLENKVKARKNEILASTIADLEHKIKINMLSHSTDDSRWTPAGFANVKAQLNTPFVNADNLLSMFDYVFSGSVITYQKAKTSAYLAYLKNDDVFFSVDSDIIKTFPFMAGGRDKISAYAVQDILLNKTNPTVLDFYAI